MVKAPRASTGYRNPFDILPSLKQGHESKYINTSQLTVDKHVYIYKYIVYIIYIRISVYIHICLCMFLVAWILFLFGVKIHIDCFDYGNNIIVHY